MRFTLILVLVLSYVVSGDVLAAERRCHKFTPSEEIAYEQFLSKHSLKTSLAPSDSLKAQKETSKLTKKKGKHRKFWLKVLFTFSVIFAAAGLASMFFVATLGWWVVLTAAVGILAGVTIMYIAEKKSGSQVAGLGAIGLFVLAGILWWLGLLGVMMYMVT